METVGWPINVNDKILDATTISIGESGFIEDASSNGFKYRRATSLASTDKYNVTMDFDWLEKDANNLSEFDRFVRWYKYKHQYGANPFWFDSIARFSINGPLYDDSGNIVQCKYKIAGPLNCQKSGFSMRVTMPWEEVYAGVVNIADEIPVLDHLEAKNGEIVMIYTQPLTYTPTPDSLTFSYAPAGTTDINEFTDFSEPKRVRAVSDKVISVEVDMGDLIVGQAYTISADYQLTASHKVTFVA